MKIINILMTCLLFVGVFHRLEAQTAGAPYFVPVKHPSTNGTAIVSDYICTIDSAGTMIIGTPVSGVTQTLAVTVSSAGTYNISATANGVTFAATGSWASAGSYLIDLTATGTPTATGSHTFTLNTTPNCNFSRTTDNHPSTNGTGIVSGYACDTNSVGTMTIGSAVIGVSQTITATVLTIGTYTITTTANGVTFAASGTFAGTGAQNIVLTATGTPTAAGSHSFTLNTTPNCSFSRTTINQPSTNGTAIVTAYACNSIPVGKMITGTAVVGVTYTITATVDKAGTYNISTTANGVTFAGTGTFVGTGFKAIVLTATGMPTATGVHLFTLNTTPNCSFYRMTTGGVIPGNATCDNVIISKTSCAGLAGATLNDDTGTSLGTEYDWTPATSSDLGTGFGASSPVRAIVEIGGQCWARINMNIFYGIATPPSNDGVDRTSCNYYGGTSFANEGYLYQWSAAMIFSESEGARGVCPVGWHIPTDCEFMFLENSLGMTVTDQELMGAWRDSGAVGDDLIASPNGTNISGFNGLMTGYGQFAPNYLLRGSNTNWWTSSRTDTTKAHGRKLGASNTGTNRNQYAMASNFSVRCLKD